MPDRTRLVLAKLAAHLVAGFVIGALAYVLCAVIVLPILNARDVETGLEGSELVKILVGGSIAAALFAGLGVGLGALVRNQVGAIVGSLAYLFVIEPLIGIIPGIDDTVAKWGLGGLSDALAGGNERLQRRSVRPSAGRAGVRRLRGRFPGRRHLRDATARRHLLSACAACG